MENQFNPEDGCCEPDSSEPSSQFSIERTVEKTGSSCSMTDFFRAGTSRIGFSFDQSVSGGSSCDRFRPSFGFGKIVSPERQPVAVVEPFVGEDEEADRVRGSFIFCCVCFALRITFSLTAQVFSCDLIL